MRIKDLTEGEFTKGFEKGLGTDTGFVKTLKKTFTKSKKQNPLADIDTSGLKFILRDILRGNTLDDTQLRTLKSIYSKL